MSGKEWAIEKKVCEYAESKGWLAIKFTPTGQRGWPDRLFINPFGIHVYVEFKKPKAQLKKIQEYRKIQLCKRDCYVYGPVACVEMGKEIIDTHASEIRMDAPRIPAFCIKVDDEAG